MSWRYVVRRLLQAVPALAAVVVITFLVIQFVPGDPAYTLAGPDADEAEFSRVRREYGLDRPVLSQLATYAGRLASGDLGVSYSRGRSVTEVVLQHLPPPSS